MGSESSSTTAPWKPNADDRRADPGLAAGGQRAQRLGKGGRNQRLAMLVLALAADDHRLAVGLHGAAAQCCHQPLAQQPSERRAGGDQRLDRGAAGAGQRILQRHRRHQLEQRLAIRLAGARGDITDTAQVAWKLNRLTPYVSSPLLYGDTLYFLRHNQNILSRLEPKTGKPLGEPIRLEGVRDIFASPVGAAGRIYVTDRDGATLVLRHDRENATLALNRLDAIMAPTNGPAWVSNLQTGDDFTNFVSASTPGAVSGYPNLTVPAGHVDGVLPIGMSLFASRFSEPTLIALAYSFEQATHARRLPDLRAARFCSSVRPDPTADYLVREKLRTDP